MPMPKDNFYSYEKLDDKAANGLGHWLAQKVGSMNSKM